MHIEHRVPTLVEYRELRAAVGWEVPSPDACEVALRHGSVGAVALDRGRTIGMGRVVGDVRFYAFVVDLVVAPDAQRVGVGRRLLRALEQQVAATSSTKHMHLVADDDVVTFYRGLGYERSASNLMQRSLDGV